MCANWSYAPYYLCQILSWPVDPKLGFWVCCVCRLGRQLAETKKAIANKIKVLMATSHFIKNYRKQENQLFFFHWIVQVQVRDVSNLITLDSYCEETLPNPNEHTLEECQKCCQSETKILTQLTFCFSCHCHLFQSLPQIILQYTISFQQEPPWLPLIS